MRFTKRIAKKSAMTKASITAKSNSKHFFVFEARHKTAC
jgi:hypothetical protein